MNKKIISYNDFLNESFKYNVEFDNEKESPAQILIRLRLFRLP